MKNVLIFGVSGFVGNYLAQEFIDAGYKVYGSDITDNPNLLLDISFQNADLMNSADVKMIVD